MITSLLIDIIAVYTIVLILMYLGLTLFGLVSLREERLKHRLLVENSERKTPEPIGISLIVGGRVAPDELEQLLSLDYFNYEVILVAQLSKQRDELLQKYSMIEVSTPRQCEISNIQLEHVYRSRERRYRKLVIVDRPFTTLCDAYNSGVCISSLDYVLTIHRHTKLYPDALRRLSSELQDHTGEVFAVGALRCRMQDTTPQCALDYVVKLVTVGAGVGALAGIGTHPNTIIMFEYSAIIEAGGYRNNFHPDLDLYLRIKRLEEQTTSVATAIFTPQIITRPTHYDAVCCSRTPSMAMHEKSPLASRITMSVMIVATLALLPTTALRGEWETFHTILWIYLSAYTGTITIALLAMVSYRQTLIDQGFSGSITKVLLSTLIYPFLLLRSLVRAKNFIKS